MCRHLQVTAHSTYAADEVERRALGQSVASRTYLAAAQKTVIFDITFVGSRQRMLRKPHKCYLQTVTCNPKRTTVETLSNMTITIILRQDEQQIF